MTKKLAILLLLALLTVDVSAQVFNFGRRSYFKNNPVKKYPGIGIGGGTTYFLGDLGSAEKGVIRPALNFKFDYRLTRSLAVEFNSGGGMIAQKYDKPSYYLADFETTFGHAHLNFRFHFDNMFNLKSYAIVSPYLTAGFGYMIFESYRNIYDSNGDLYDVSDDGIITVNGLPVSRDNNFETPIDENNDYAHNTVIMPVGAGIKFQFSEHFEMNIEGMMYYTDHDYIDGYLSYHQTPEGNWERNEPNEDNDAYFFGTITFMYNFGFNPKRRARRYVPPVMPSF